MRRMKQRPRFYGSKTMVRRFQEIYLYFSCIVSLAGFMKCSWKW